jgi:hypothetical protein
MSDDQGLDATSSAETPEAAGQTEPTIAVRVAEVSQSKTSSEGKGSTELTEAWAPAATFNVLQERMSADSSVDNRVERAGPPAPAGSNTAGKEEPRESSD